MEQTVFIFHLWNARRKSRVIAEVEAYYLLRDLEPQILQGGPLSEKKGVFWIALPKNSIGKAKARLDRLGYTQCVEIPVVVPESELPPNPQKSVMRGDLIRWRKKYHKPLRIYEASSEIMWESAPDRREFLLKMSDGQFQSVRGYRGDGKALSRRGLPPYDARMLVNLVRPRDASNIIFLDPFAGIGGIILEAITSGFKVISSDIDPFLMYGLANYGSKHIISDARNMPFADESIDAIATEPPYDRIAEEIVHQAIIEMVRILKYGSRLAILCATWQARGIRKISRSLNLETILDASVNRKGTECVVFTWKKN